MANDVDDFSRIILIDKPAGLSSFGVVARVRRQLTVQAGRKIKVGHCGTLDPFATGLLILVSGKFTRRAGEFSKLDKVYETTIKLGATSSTGDPEGEISEHLVEHIPTAKEVQSVVNSFVGEIEQTPPRYSAIKINGRRAYQLARQGADFVVPTRRVQIYSIEILKYNYPLLQLRAHVSSGTYIRTLGEDIGQKLQTGGYLIGLRRLRIADYSVEDAETLDNRGTI